MAATPTCRRVVRGSLRRWVATPTRAASPTVTAVARPIWSGPVPSVSSVSDGACRTGTRWSRSAAVHGRVARASEPAIVAAMVTIAAGTTTSSARRTATTPQPTSGGRATSRYRP